jgi:hypothetical protein
LLRNRGTKWYAILLEEQEADKVMVQSTTQDALALSGAWSDLEWDELEKALNRLLKNPVL